MSTEMLTRSELFKMSPQLIANAIARGEITVMVPQMSQAEIDDAEKDKWRTNKREWQRRKRERIRAELPPLPRPVLVPISRKDYPRTPEGQLEYRRAYKNAWVKISGR